MQSEEIRIATDGGRYTFAEFNTHYGTAAQWYWDQAGPDDTDWYPEEVPCPCLTGYLWVG